MGGFIRVLSSIGLPEFVKIFFRNLFQNIWVWLAFLLPWIVQKIVVLLGMGVVYVYRCWHSCRYIKSICIRTI